MRSKNRARSSSHRRSQGEQPLRVLAFVVVFGLGTLAAVSAIERVTAPAEPTLAAASHAQHTPPPARTVLGPLTASTGDMQVRLEARVADDTASGIPAGQKVLLTFQLTDPLTGQRLAGLTPSAALESAVPLPSNSYAPADTGDPFDARDTFVLVNGAGDLGVLESDASGSHRHQPGSSLTRLTGSSFAAVVKLPGASAEAVADGSGRYIFASIPDADQVAVVDTLSHRLVHNLAVGRQPIHLAVEPSGRRVWVGNDGDGTVTAIDTATHETRTTRVGLGHHEFAFSLDSRLAFVSSQQAGTVSAIATDSAEVVSEAPAGRAPHGLDFADGQLFVADEAAGVVVVLGLAQDRLVPNGTIPAGQGTRQVRIHPLAKVGVASNHAANTLTIFDASTLEAGKTVAAGGGPDGIVFVEDYAIVRNSLSPDVTFVNVTNPGVADEVPTGGQPYLDAPHAGVHARLFLNATGDEVLVPSPAEGQVYQLHVMMGRPMLMSQMQVDRGSEVVVSPTSQVHEISPGTYQRVVRFGVEGAHTLTIRPADGREAVTFPVEVVSPRALRPWIVTVLPPEAPYMAGQEGRVRFKVETRRAGSALLQDPMVMVWHFAPGQVPWQRLVPALNVGDGVYEASVIFPSTGSFSATLSSLSDGLSADDVPPTTFEVTSS